jgi:hypothetical protein
MLARPTAINWNLVAAELAQLVAIAQTQTGPAGSSRAFSPSRIPERVPSRPQRAEQT